MSSIKNALHLVHSVITPYLSWLVILLYLFLTLPALLDADHMLKNLEPYPDGLLYALASKQAATDGKLALVYNGTELEYWVPPLYSLALVPFYFLSQQPEVFYVANVVFGATSIFVLLTLVRKLTGSRALASAGTLLFVLHGYILWLPTVPMAENLQLLLCLLALACLLLPKKLTLSWLLILFALSAALVFSKYAAVFTAGTFVLIGLYRARTVLSIREWIVLSLMALMSYLLFWYVVQNPFDLLGSFFTAVMQGGNQYLAASYVFPNFSAYLQGLTVAGPFLWLTQPLSSLAVVLTVLVTSGYLYYRKELKITHVFLLVLLCATLLLPLFFYVADTRYILLWIPILVVLLSLQLHSVLTDRGVTTQVIVWTGVILLHLVQQAPLLKQVVTANLLQRTTAWQYESIQHFNAVFGDAVAPEPVLITALPPFLVSAYQTSNYRVVPLAYTQEFISKEQYVWGDDIKCDGLKETYASWIAEGREVYISNAYITHQASVIEAYESYKETFEFEKISTGCLDACAVYSLSIKQTDQ